MVNAKERCVRAAEVNIKWANLLNNISNGNINLKFSNISHHTIDQVRLLQKNPWVYWIEQGCVFKGWGCRLSIFFLLSVNPASRFPSHPCRPSSFCLLSHSSCPPHVFGLFSCSQIHLLACFPFTIPGTSPSTYTPVSHFPHLPGTTVLLPTTGHYNMKREKKQNNNNVLVHLSVLCDVPTQSVALDATPVCSCLRHKS